MIRLDSTKIKADISCIEDFNPAYFNDSQTINDTAIIRQCKELKKAACVGLGNIKIDEINGTAEFLLSSKILYDDYSEGINKNTISQAVKNINDTGIVKLNFSSFIDSAICLNTDETHTATIDNLIVNWKDISTALSCSIVNSKYSSKPYKQLMNKGIVFTSDLSSKKERLIMYCKLLDLQKAGNRQFIKALLNPTKVLNDSKNHLRIEGNNTSFKTIRERFNLSKGSPMLADILTATGQPLIHYINDITNQKKNMQLELILQSEYTGRMFLEVEGISNILRACNYDIHTARQVIASKFTPANFEKYWYGRKNRPGIATILPKIIAQDNNQLPGTLNPIMKTIINQLEYDYAI